MKKSGNFSGEETIKQTMINKGGINEAVLECVQK